MRPMSGFAARALSACGMLFFASSPASARPPEPITALDDARACAPLDGGSMAVGTGGGLVIASIAAASVVLTSLDGLPETRVHAVARDGDRLWVGTEGGAALVDLAPAPRVARAFPRPAAPVRVVLPADGGAYAGTWGAGVWRLGATDGSAEPIAAEGPGSQVSALASRDGDLYVAFADGPLARLEAGALRPVVREVTRGQSLAWVATDRGPRLVLGDLQGLRLVDGDPVSFSSVDARSLAADGATLLVGTFGTGLLSGGAGGELHRDPAVPAFVRAVAAAGSIRCAATTDGLFVDEEGRGWQARSFGGLPSNDVTALAAEGGRVAVGTFDAGAAIVEGGTPRRLPGLAQGETVNAVAWQGAGARARLWIATGHGLFAATADGVTLRLGAEDGLPSDVVRALLVLDDATLLVGTDAGPATVAGHRAVPLAPAGAAGASGASGKNGLASPMHATWALAVTPDRRLWIGTTAGLYYGHGTHFRRASLATRELTDDWVTALAVRGSDVWVGTYSGGVTRLRPSGDRVAAAHLGGGYVNPDGITVVGDAVYAATMDGLLSRPGDDDEAAWQRHADAAPGRDVTAVRAVGDELWVGSRRGVGRFLPGLAAPSP